MRKFFICMLMGSSFTAALLSFTAGGDKAVYAGTYMKQMNQFIEKQRDLIQAIAETDLVSVSQRNTLRNQINIVRIDMKAIDFWARYLDPIAYKKINGPLPVEWETEVFEKFEKPYKREGAGFTLALTYLDQDEASKDSLLTLLNSALKASEAYFEDSITRELKFFDHFYLCNRLYLLNLAAIYTTGFECPDESRIIPELKEMLSAVECIYEDFNESFPGRSLPTPYLNLYGELQRFCASQPVDFNKFDHFSFVQKYVGPLYGMNQQLIRKYQVKSHSYVDYSLNRSNDRLFSKNLYFGQVSKGVFLRLADSGALYELDRLGKLLFYDPILSGNNLRSCASCHKPSEYFNDTGVSTSLQFNGKDRLTRNSPTLINSIYNHLVMADGMHISLQDQTQAVLTNPREMGADSAGIMKKIMSCREYKVGFQKLLEHTPLYDEVSLDHISSAITYYYSKFSAYDAMFDKIMNGGLAANAEVKEGFNIFMSKAKCATCHFVPQFNGVKPPYVSSEFEVLGVPDDTSFSRVSDDSGRYKINPAMETLRAFRTGSLRNSSFTAPYMHNGVFKTMKEVIDFYDAGGGAGRGLLVPNQTLDSDSLRLTVNEKNSLLSFLRSLDEEVVFEKTPRRLPLSSITKLNSRKPGGEY